MPIFFVSIFYVAKVLNQYACEAASKIEVDSANLEKIAADAAKAKSVTAEVKATVEALKAKTAAAAAIKVNI